MKDLTKRNIPNIIIEDATIIYKNFSGIGDDFTREGDRNFSVILDDDEQIEALIRDGWNVKQKTPKEDGDRPMSYIKVAVNYNGRPPKVVMVINNKQVPLNNNTIASLDNANITSADLVITPYLWKVGNKEGIRAYVKTLYAVVLPDEFEGKYCDI